MFQKVEHVVQHDSGMNMAMNIDPIDSTRILERGVGALTKGD